MQEEMSLPGTCSGWTETVLVVDLHPKSRPPASEASGSLSFPLVPVDQLRLAFSFSPWLLVSPTAFWLQH